jgi:Histidine kinase-, DNA gyrase B-, and HSP90-like ATPase/Clp amino terminal domain, pathogenicity island component
LRAARTVAQALLTLARSEYGHLRREPVDLAAAAADVLRSHDHHELDSTTALEPARTTGSPLLVERLVANLIGNAVRHNMPGGRLDVATDTAAGHAIFTVANTGPVIPTGELIRLFQPFQQRSSHEGSSADGVGLGLAIVQTIANAHDAMVNGADPGLSCHAHEPPAPCRSRVSSLLDCRPRSHDRATSASGARRLVRERLDVGSTSAPGLQLWFSPEAKDALKSAHQFGLGEPGTEHMLIVILGRGEGSACEIPRALGADPHRIRSETRSELGRPALQPGQWDNCARRSVPGELDFGD